MILGVSQRRRMMGGGISSTKTTRTILSPPISISNRMDANLSRPQKISTPKQRNRRTSSVICDSKDCIHDNILMIELLYCGQVGRRQWLRCDVAAIYYVEMMPPCRRRSSRLSSLRPTSLRICVQWIKVCVHWTQSLRILESVLNSNTLLLILIEETDNLTLSWTFYHSYTSSGCQNSFRSNSANNNHGKYHKTSNKQPDD